MKFSISNNSNLDMKQMKPLLKSFVPFAQKKMGFDRPVRINFASDNQNAANPLGKTAFYDPNVSEVTIFTDQRHPKDILRSLAHELVHHTQNCRGDFDKKPELGEDYFQHDPFMREIEREAMQDGAMCFRDWEEKYRKQLQESIYYTKGDNSKMSYKNWRDQEMNGRLMESWGYKAPKKEILSEVAEARGRGRYVSAAELEEGEEPLTELTDEERYNLETYDNIHGHAGAAGSNWDYYENQGIPDPGPVRDGPKRSLPPAREPVDLTSTYPDARRGKPGWLGEEEELEEGGLANRKGDPRQRRAEASPIREEEELEEGHDCGDHDGMTHEEWVKESDEKTIREAIRRAFAKAIKERTNKRD